MDRILIVDDDELVRTGLAADLRHGGFEVEVAASGSEGVAALAKSVPDLVLLDVLLDTEDGIHVLGQIREMHPQLPVVMVSGNASLKSTVGALRAGANDFFMKPAEPVELVHRVRKVIDAQRDRVLAEQAERSLDKLQSLQTLAGGIAHDLNNQLTVILGFVQEMLREPDTGKECQQMMGAIQQSGDVIAILADKLLAYSGGGLFEVESVDLTDSFPTRIREMADRLKTSLESDAVIEVTSDHKKLTAAIDRHQIERVIEGILYNAFEAINGSGGSVKIELAARGVDRALLQVEPRLSSLKPGTYARIRVTDNGSGMSLETMRNVFDPFFSTKFTGRGLGLPAALGVIRAHQGQLVIDSQVGVGTVVECYLPLQEPMQARRATPASFPVEAEAEEDAPVSGHVLIIDDEQPIRKMAARVLEKAGLEVTESQDGPSGLRRIEAQPDVYDLVLLDLTMPEMDGVEVLREIRKMRPQTPVLLISGYHSKDVIGRFTDDQPDAFIQKPFDVQTLRQKVRQMIRTAQTNAS